MNAEKSYVDYIDKATNYTKTKWLSLKLEIRKKKAHIKKGTRPGSLYLMLNLINKERI